MKILNIHHTDLDGAGAAAIVGLYHKDDEITYKMYNYGWPISPDELKGYDIIYAVDISFPDFPWVYDTPGLIWIDHHKTAIDYENSHPSLKSIPGVRKIGKGACELTWEYLFPEYICHDLIQILSTYDVWDKNRMNWDVVMQIEVGAKQVLGISPQNIINFILSNRNPEELRVIGNTILGYIEKSGKGKLMNGFYIPDFHGFSIMALNTNEFSSLSFISYYNPSIIDVCMPFQIIPKDNKPGEFYVRASFYTENPNVDVSGLAEYFGGGGHKGASGCQMSLNDLTNILSYGYSLKDYFKTICYKGNDPKFYKP